MTCVELLYCFPGDDDQRLNRIGNFRLDTTGIARLEVYDERARAELEDLAAGVRPGSLKRCVLPAEGPIFLAALAELFANSRDHVVVDKSSGRNRQF